MSLRGERAPIGRSSSANIVPRDRPRSGVYISLKLCSGAYTWASGYPSSPHTEPLPAPHPDPMPLSGVGGFDAVLSSGGTGTVIGDAPAGLARVADAIHRELSTV